MSLSTPLTPVRLLSHDACGARRAESPPKWKRSARPPLLLKLRRREEAMVRRMPHRPRTAALNELQRHRTARSAGATELSIHAWNAGGESSNATRISLVLAVPSSDENAGTCRAALRTQRQHER